MSQHLLFGIGQRLRHIRQTKEQTLTDLADQEGVSKSLLSKIETGRREPSLPVLLNLAVTNGTHTAAQLQPYPHDALLDTFTQLTEAISAHYQLEVHT